MARNFPPYSLVKLLLLWLNARAARCKARLAYRR